ncbi:MAG: SDR family NAD(P)-dependent oxidoreductase [Pseudomonadota bacterium]
MNRDVKRIAITGGTGFVGKRFIEHALSHNIEISALARKASAFSSDAEARSSGQLTIVQGDLADGDALRRIANSADVFIHCAGLTHALRAEEMERVNVDGSAAAARAAMAAGALFLQISSMAARCPELSTYSATKRAGEEASRNECASDQWLALRPPAIFGPGDTATLPLFKMVKAGFAPEPATPTVARASILYVDDVVMAMLSAAKTAKPGLCYDIDDTSSDGYSWREIGETLGEAFGKQVRSFRTPRIVMEAQAILAEAAGRVRGKASFVNRGKVAEFFHPDWVARDNLLSAHTEWAATIPLRDGFAKTLSWYQDQGLI